MLFLRQSTASQSVVIGPFVDSTDGNTAETGLTVDAADIRLSKNGANIVGKNSGGGTHDELGYYTITLDATDTNTVGRLQLMVHESGALPVYHEYQVLEEAVYDAMYASSAVGPLLANSNGSGLTEAGGTGDHLTAVPYNSAWDADIQSECADAITAAGLATATNLATVDTVVDGIKAVTDNLPDSGALTSLATAAALATVDGNVDSVLEDTGTTLPATLSTIAGYLDTEIAAIKAVTDALPDAGALTSIATAAALTTVDTVVDAIKVTTDKLDDTLEDDAGTFRFTENALEQAPSGTGASAASIADAVWTEAIGDHSGVSGSTAEALAAASAGGGLDAAGVRAAIGLASANLDTQLSGIAADAGDILEDTGTTIPASIAALNNLSQANVRTAVGLASANLDTQLAALPTAAENRAEMDSNSTQLAAIVADTNELQTDDVPGLIAALNDFDPASETVSLATNGITAAVIATDAIDAAALATDAVQEIRNAILAGTITELTGDPGASPELAEALALLYMATRNRRDTTASSDEIHNNAGTAILQADVSDDGVTFTKAKYVEP